MPAKKATVSRSATAAKAGSNSSPRTAEKPIHGNSPYKPEFAKQAEVMTKLGTV